MNFFAELTYHVRAITAIATLLLGRGIEWTSYRVMDAADWIAPDDFHNGDDNGSTEVNNDGPEKPGS